MATADILAKAARALDGVETGIACAGTKLEATTFAIGGKNFLFIDRTNARLKLDASADAARAMAETPDGPVRCGKGGWATIRLADGESIGAALLKRWVAESYGALGGAGESKMPRATAAKKRGGAKTSPGRKKA